MKTAIIGAGGHAREVFHAISQQGVSAMASVDGFYVEPEFLGKVEFLYGLPVRSIEELDTEVHALHLAIGDPELRQRMYESFKSFGFSFVTVIDPRANVPKLMNVEMGEGTYIAPGSTITSEAKIGKCVIINTGAIVSHDCEIQDFCTISPGVVLCGNVRIGERSYIGAGSIIREKIWIRDRVTLGMGSVVIKNILDPGTYVIHDNTTKKL